MPKTPNFISVSRGIMSVTAIACLEACLDALRIWLCHNGLCLNPDKSESIRYVAQANACAHSPVIPSIKIAGNDIKLSDQITSLGVIMDSTLTFDAHVTALCKACHFHLGSLRHIRHSLSTNMATSIAVAMVQSRLDYCNSLLSDISAFNINKLQRVQNFAAKIALNDWHSLSQELLSQLHWLRIHSCIKFKISSFTFKLLAENQPANLRSLITPYVPPRLLRSSDKSLLVQPPTRTSIGKRAFSVSAPYSWNSIPLPIRLSPSIASFKRNLKTFYFATS